MAQLENELAWKLAASLANRIGGDRYEIYFDNQTFQFEHGTLLIQAANEFSRERIRSQFDQQIRSSVSEVLGDGVSIAYVVAGQPRVQQSLFDEIPLAASDSPQESPVGRTVARTEAALAPASALEQHRPPHFRSMEVMPGARGENGSRAEAGQVTPSRQGVAEPSSSQAKLARVEGPFPVAVGTTDRRTARLAPSTRVHLREETHGQRRLFDAAEDSEAVATIVEPKASPASDVARNSSTDGPFPTSPQPAPDRQPIRTQGSRSAMTLATYQFGQANHLAKAAVQQVIQQPGSVTPVLFHGPVGCGKTHLSSGLATQLRQTYRRYSALQLSAEQFTSRFLEALNGSGLPSLRAKFREVDLLVLEDIQFFHGKKATIVELQHTLDALIRTGKQVVLTSDRHPNDLTFLGSEVQTRLVSGLVVGLNPADRDARQNVCQQWCQRQGVRIEDSLVDWLAEHIVGDVRRLCGALFRVMAMQASTGQMVTPATAMDVLSDYVSASHAVCSLGQIQKVVCDVCGVDVGELNSSRRTRKVSGARMLAMFLARKHTQAALSEIGDFFGGRRHSTVLAAEKRIKNWEQGNQIMETGTQAVNARELIRKVEAKLSAM